MSWDFSRVYLKVGTTRTANLHLQRGCCDYCIRDFTLARDFTAFLTFIATWAGIYQFQLHIL